jgi:hypothetical protein
MTRGSRAAPAPRRFELTRSMILATRERSEPAASLPRAGSSVVLESGPSNAYRTRAQVSRTVRSGATVSVRCSSSNAK